MQAIMKAIELDVSTLIEGLRSTDPEIFQQAFGLLLRDIDSIKSTIYQAAVREENARAKGALVELLGETRDPKYMPFIADQLHSSEPEVIFWAYVALQTIGTAESLALANNVSIKEIAENVRRRKSADKKLQQ